MGKAKVVKDFRMRAVLCRSTCVREKKCAYKRNKEEAVGRETPENTPNFRVSSR